VTELPTVQANEHASTNLSRVRGGAQSRDEERHVVWFALNDDRALTAFAGMYLQLYRPHWVTRFVEFPGRLHFLIDPSPTTKILSRYCIFDQLI
jgi:hypothetical protein